MKRLLFVVALACAQTVSAETAPSGLAAKVVGAEIIGGASGHFASTVTRMPQIELAHPITVVPMHIELAKPVNVAPMPRLELAPHAKANTIWGGSDANVTAATVALDRVMTWAVNAAVANSSIRNGVGSDAVASGNEAAIRAGFAEMRRAVANR